MNPLFTLNLKSMFLVTKKACNKISPQKCLNALFNRFYAINTNLV